MTSPAPPQLPSFPLYPPWEGLAGWNKEWKNDFASFRDWALDNKYQNNLTIDRIDNNGDYKPSNCQWITNIENAKKGNKLLREIKLGLEG